MRKPRPRKNASFLLERMEQLVADSSAETFVFLREDFKALGGYDQVGRGLRQMIQKGLLVKVGHGVYVKAKWSDFAQKPVPQNDIFDIGYSLLKRFGITPKPSRATREYNEGKTTQIPTVPFINVGKSRIVRKIQFGKQTFYYERGD